MTDLSRRGFLAGLIAACAAPAIIRTPGLIMPIKQSLVTPRNIFISVDTARDEDGYVEYTISGLDFLGKPITQVVKMPAEKYGDVGMFELKEPLSSIRSVSLRNFSGGPVHVGGTKITVRSVEGNINEIKNNVIGRNPDIFYKADNGDILRFT